ncbi:hypothetical protein ACTWPT_56790 [Nonomuraea sp. 3N208]|uniref:hypothetical protein n=1 Tax=Nonomuraea sp. 3N208 TaxID=3457421 RepID=UPI003FCF2D0A
MTLGLVMVSYVNRTMGTPELKVIYTELIGSNTFFQGLGGSSVEPRLEVLATWRSGGVPYVASAFAALMSVAGPLYGKWPCSWARDYSPCAAATSADPRPSALLARRGPPQRGASRRLGSGQRLPRGPAPFRSPNSPPLPSGDATQA